MKPARAFRLAAAIASLSVATSLAPAAAIAQPSAAAPDDASKRSQAKAYVDAGLAAHDRGDYDAAIALYGKAYALVPHPVLFFNMGQAHRLAGRTAEAMEMYRRYLAEVSTGSLADQARVWIATLEVQPASPPIADPAKPSAAATPAPAVPLSGKSDEAPAGSGGVPAPAPSHPDDGRTLRLSGYAAGAVGVVALGVGGLYGLRARRLSDELSTPGAPYDTGKFEDGQSAERMMIVFYGVGGALLAGGAILYVLGDRADRPGLAGTAGLSADVAPGRVGVSWTSRF
jgi:tetratricopeptide (TPR) repeat protein